MYREFYGFKCLPFQLLPDPDFFYRSEKHETALTHLEYGVFERAGFILITGEIGTGKTTLLRYLLRSLDKDLPVALLTQTYLSPEDLLRALCQEFLLPHKNLDKPELLELIGEFLVERFRKGQYVTLILDEAQNLPAETLEEIRMLSNLDADNERLLQIILSGQPPLRTKLQRKELRQLYQRVEVSYHLKPLDRLETGAYIRHRLNTAGGADPELFDEPATDAIFDYSGGVPRLINAACHGCLVYGFADTQKKITRALVEAVLKDRENWGLYPKAESLAMDDGVDSRADSAPKPEVGQSQDLAAAKLDRLVAISESSMQTLESVTSELARVTGEGRIAALKDQLAGEKKVRLALEDRLAQAEATVSRLETLVSKLVQEDTDTHRQGTSPGLAKSEPAPDPVREQRPDFEHGTSVRQTGEEKLLTANIAGRMRRALTTTLKRLRDEWRSGSLGANLRAVSTWRRRPVPLYLIIGTAICLAIALGWWAAKEPQSSGPQVALSYSQKVPVPEKPLGPAKTETTIDEKKTPPPPSPTPDPARLQDRPSTLETEPSNGRSDSTESPPAIMRNTAAPIRSSPERLAAPVKTAPETAAAPVQTFPESPAVSQPAPPAVISADTYVCIVRSGNVRSSPSLSASIVDSISRDERVWVVGKAEDWLQVELANGTSGWAHESLLRRYSP